MLSGLLYAYAAGFMIQLHAEGLALGPSELMLIIQALVILVLFLRIYNMRKWEREPALAED